MKEFGLTGGIGSGKSTVSKLLEITGATVIDADAIVHELQEPGEPVFAAMVERWSDRVVGSDGELDRAEVASIVFSDELELAALNEIVHPALSDEVEARLARARQLEAVDGAVESIVVHDIPLLVQPGGALMSSRDIAGWAGIIVVDTPIELATQRVVEHRGMAPDDVAARIAQQATREERRAVADFVIDNQGSLPELDAQVDSCWAWMSER